MTATTDPAEGRSPNPGPLPPTPPGASTRPTSTGSAEPAGATDLAELDSPYDPEEELELPAHRRRFGLLTMVLSLLLVAGLGVYGGVRLQKSRSSSSTGSTSALASALASRFGGTGTRGAGTGAAGRGTGAAGGFGGFGAAGGTGGAGGGSTVGTVKLVDGNTIYLSQTDGSIVKVTTTPSGTTVTKTVSSSVGAIQPGETLVVQGSTGSDGTVTATRVTDAGATAAAAGSGTGTGS